MIFRILIAILLFPLPAHAQGLTESPDSYYARHLKSCESKERTKPWHIIAALSPTITDECCAASVAAMRAAGAKRIAPDDTCPDGQTKRALDCPTSKHWCE